MKNFCCLYIHQSFFIHSSVDGHLGLFLNAGLLLVRLHFSTKIVTPSWFTYLLSLDPHLPHMDVQAPSYHRAPSDDIIGDLCYLPTLPSLFPAPLLSNSCY